ncbi:hypothetical protein Natpe_2006 [Natrinema pellirubrum DSM 15624]|uniref:Uncharacterized protein n=1 Tax=Natrinema pellirubrum (strain DSM 15624 / CIP 106293 / JCM 10476 / NCIMB 786 / 157) TaxID=797303 RepID=L0JKQ9_NATP1|nr:hypothetical protein Natpe_2006 [Natrinema pellirubrum DSM 15624]
MRCPNQHRAVSCRAERGRTRGANGVSASATRPERAASFKPFLVSGPDCGFQRDCRRERAPRCGARQRRRHQALERESPRGAQPKTRLMLASRPDSLEPGTVSDVRSEPQPGMVGRERRGGRHAASGAGRYPSASNRRNSSPISPHGWDQKGLAHSRNPADASTATCEVRSETRDSSVPRAFSLLSKTMVASHLPRPTPSQLFQ